VGVAGRSLRVERALCATRFLAALSLQAAGPQTPTYPPLAAEGRVWLCARRHARETGWRRLVLGRCGTFSQDLLRQVVCAEPPIVAASCVTTEREPRVGKRGTNESARVRNVALRLESFCVNLKTRMPRPQCEIRRPSEHATCREETMRNALSATGLAFAYLLSTASIALAAEPGSEDPGNWPAIQSDCKRVAVQSARSDQQRQCQ
jgi:hypothetical protein